ncbi:hypothetical protein BK816_01665 [Boudabousia tangfeifanii]|uniref:N-acetyltransferase domain-containing protein n=2 Tax=Boudabousia tangfeifanii TaxID=1912795 RepID=A0A1D9MIZ5_9ACTO|nr:hypothetical protein BK816_01665 [Boudabousia tangfeifanii]
MFFHDLSGADDPVWEQAFPVLQQLRTHLTREALAEVIAEGAPQGLRFTALFYRDKCVAVAGWRIIANTNLRRVLYVDDLCVDETTRSHGYGQFLLNELTRRAKEAGARALDLDSGVQRHAAHRFYLRNRFIISSHHFRLELPS